MEEENPILVTSGYDHTIKFWQTITPLWGPERTIEIKEVNKLLIIN